jgi:hypothetical protein
MMKKDHLSKSVSHCSVYVNFAYHNQKVSNWKQQRRVNYQVCLLLKLTDRLGFLLMYIGFDCKYC